MNYKSKTKAELIAELEKLQQSTSNFLPHYDIHSTTTENIVAAQNDNIIDFSETKEYFELIFNTSPDVALISRMSDAQIIKINDSFTTITGYTRQEALNESALNLNLWKNLKERTYVFDELRKKGFCENVATEFIRKDGSSFHALVSAKTFHYKGFDYIFSTSRDITELKTIEEKLRLSEERFRLLFENSGDAIMLTNPDGSIFSANPEACRMLQRTEEEIQNLGRSGILDINDPRLPAALELRKNTGCFKGELNFVRKDGTIFPAEVSSIVYTNSQSEERTSLLIKDISHRKIAEKILKESEIKFHNLFANSQVGKFRTLVNESRVVEVNDKLCEIFGYSKEELIARPLNINYANPQRRNDLMLLLKQSNVVNDFECDIIAKNGTIKTLLASMYFYPNEGILDGTLVDITDRKLTEEKLKETALSLKYKNELFDALFNNIPLGIFMVDVPMGKPLLANEAALNLLGRGILPDVSKQNLNEVYKAFKQELNNPYPIDEMPIIRGMRGEYSQIDDMLVVRPDGTLTHLEVFGAPVKNEKGEVWASLVSFMDIAERKKLESELVKSKEMLKKFATHLQNNQEEERILLATKLDNELGQILVASKMQIGMLKNKIIKENADSESIHLIQKLDEIHSTIGNSIKTTLNFMNDLRFEVLHLMGFVEAVKLYSADFETKNKIKCSFTSNVQKLEIEENDATSLFRILQIALDNVAKHSFAFEATINLTKTKEKITLEISDNGTGFNINQTYLPSSNGIIFMQERALLLNGKLEIRSETLKGTTIKVEIPIS